MIGLLPLFVLAERQDVGGISYPFYPRPLPSPGGPTVFIYDGYPGGGVRPPGGPALPRVAQGHPGPPPLLPLRGGLPPVRPLPQVRQRQPVPGQKGGPGPRLGLGPPLRLRSMSPVEESPEEFLARFAAHRVEVRLYPEPWGAPSSRSRPRRGSSTPWTGARPRPRWGKRGSSSTASPERSPGPRGRRASSGRGRPTASWARRALWKGVLPPFGPGASRGGPLGRPHARGGRGPPLAPPDALPGVSVRCACGQKNPPRPGTAWPAASSSGRSFPGRPGS